MASLKGGGKGKPKTKAGTVLMISLYIFIAAFFAAMFALLAVGAAPALIAVGADWFYFLLFTGIAVTLVFVFGIFETKAEIFECKDNELLLSMPIKPISIVLSRVFSVIIWNYIEAAIVFIPAVVVYAVFGGAVKGIVGGIILLLFIPLLPTALSCAMGFAVSVISARFKSKTLISVIFFLAFFTAYMFGYSALIEGADSMILNVGAVASDVGRLAFLRAVGEAALLKPLPLILIALSSVASAVLTVFVISSGFEKIASADKGEKKTRYKARRMEKKSVIYTLVKKDLSRFFSSATYIINSSLGLIFTVVFAGYAIVKIDDLIPLAEGFGVMLEIDSRAIITLAAIGVLVVCTSFSYISSCSLSLEGKSFWVMKSMPIAARDVLLAKVIAHLVITSLPTLLSSVLLLFATEEWAFFWYYILVPQAAGIVGALVGVLWNTAFPKLEFTNEAMVIKNSASVFLTMLTMMILGAALAVGGVWLAMRIGLVAVTVLELLALVLVIGLLVFILEKFATLKYESL